MDEILRRLESLFEERIALIDQYASLWAVHGGGSSTWEDHLIAIETAELRAQVRSRLSKGSGVPKEAEIKEALLSLPEYHARVREAVDGRIDWARVRERMTTLTWRIQLEMAKLRLALSDEATPTDSASGMTQ